MIRKNPQGHLPIIHESAFVDPTAIICGKIIIGENVFIGPYAVIRADEVDANGEMEVKQMLKNDFWHILTSLLKGEG